MLSYSLCNNGTLKSIKFKDSILEDKLNQNTVKYFFISLFHYLFYFVNYGKINFLIY